MSEFEERERAAREVYEPRDPESTEQPATLADHAQLVASIVVGLCILGACFSCVFGGVGR